MTVIHSTDVTYHDDEACVVCSRRGEVIGLGTLYLCQGCIMPIARLRAGSGNVVSARSSKQRTKTGGRSANEIPNGDSGSPNVIEAALSSPS